MFRTQAKHAVDSALSEVYAAQSHALFDFDELEEEISCRDVTPSQTSRFPARGVQFDELVEDRAGGVVLTCNGQCSDAAAQLAGQYVPLCQRSTGSPDLTLRLSPSFVVTGSRRRRVYACLSATSLLKREDNVEPSQFRLILAYVNDLADAPQWCQDVLKWCAVGQWCVLESSSAEWLARAPSLDGRWIVRTGVAHETEFGLRAVLGRHATPTLPPPFPVCPLCDAADSLIHLDARVIALPERAHCVAAISQQLDDALGEDGSSLLRVTLKHSAAWDTRGLDPGMLRAAGFTGGPRWKDGAKILGCALSHSEIWAEIAGRHDEEADAMVLILEDDAIINTARPVAKLLTRLVAEASKYDFVALGASTDENWSAACKSNSPPEWLCEELIRLKFFGGFWGYIITRRGARRALKALWGTASSPMPLAGDGDILVATEAQEGRLDAAMCVPNLVLHPSWGRVRHSCIDYEYAVRCERGIAAKLVGGRSAAIGPAAQSARNASVSASGASRRSPADDIRALVNRCRSVADETQQMWNERIGSQQMWNDRMTAYVGQGGRPFGYLA